MSTDLIRRDVVVDTVPCLLTLSVVCCSRHSPMSTDLIRRDVAVDTVPCLLTISAVMLQQT